MRPDLPWNVAGIPPEAREAARAAARREGLSVGEWLTRRIIRSFAGESESFEPMRETYAPPPPAYRAEEPIISARTDTADMLARVSRSESETQDIYKRIENQLGGLGRRMEQTERSTAENNRAMSKAATEINIAAREQAQAFDQLSGHVVSLSGRLDRVEQSGANDGLKDAVKSLHQGLSRLADQITTTAKHSATQIEALANNLETVAGKVAEVRNGADASARALEQRMATLDERVRVVERVSHSSADALDKALENMEARQQARVEESADINRRVGNIDHLNDALDRLTSRFASSEAQTATALSRMEDNVAKLDARGTDPAIDRRLNSIERTLGDIVAKFEGAASTDDSIRKLAMRIDAVDRKIDEAAKAPIAAAPVAPAPVVHPEPVTLAQPQHDPYAPPPPPSAPMFDAPPFPETPAPAMAKPDPFADAFAPVFAPPPADAASVFGEFAPQAQFAGGFEGTEFAPASAPPPPVTNELFLAAARRSAQAAAAQADAERSKGFAGFNWGGGAATAAPTPKVQPVTNVIDKKSSRTAYIVIGAATLVMALLIAAIVLSQRAGMSQAEHHTGIGTLFNGKPTAKTPAATQNYSMETTGGPSAAPAATAPSNDSFTAVPSVKPTTAPKTTAPAAKPAAATTATPPKATGTALDKLTALANAGNAKAELLVALKYLDGDGVPANDAEGAKWLAKAAAQNDPVAQYRMGTLYERGKGVTADAAKATHWYQLAAQAGNRKAMHNLAVAYAQGSGTQKNFAEAARWFSKAAALGLPDSQFNLAVLYERGLGVPQSLVDAYKWYAIAATQGDSESKARVDALGTQLSPDDRSAAQRSADMFKPQGMDRAANTTPDIATVTGG